MGRFGNVMLVAGETDLSLSAQLGEVVRFYLTNTANTRVFNVQLPGARMKLVGGDSGRCEREEFVESVILAPSERAVVDVLFEQPGQLTLEHRTPERTYALATIDVSAEPAAPSLAERFDDPAPQPRVGGRARAAGALLRCAARQDARASSPRWTWARPRGRSSTPARCTPTWSATEPGRCPQCGMKLLATAAAASYVCPMHPEVVSDKADRCPKCGMKLVPAAARRADLSGRARTPSTPTSTPSTVTVTSTATSARRRRRHRVGRRHGRGQPDHDAGEHALELRSTERQAPRTHAIDWRFRVGDQVKLRLVNEMDSDHPMHHPFHIHGAGRFVVLARDGVAEENLVWKDTVLVRTGETVDILLDVTNPGIWMAHCHIAEHHESGMMFSFNVAPADGHSIESK